MIKETGIYLDIIEYHLRKKAIYTKKDEGKISSMSIEMWDYTDPCH